MEARDEMSADQLRRGAVVVSPQNAPESSADHDVWAIPELAVPDYKPRSTDLIREGAYIHRRQGRLAGSPGGGRVFLFDETPEGETPAPMIVMPSVRLTEMERVLSTRDAGVTYLVTGEVFVYRGRNYLLPTAFTTLAIEREKSMEDAAPSGGDETSGIIDALRAEANSDEDRGRRGARPLDAARDGAMIMSKFGRVMRAQGGGIEFRLDNDPDSVLLRRRRDEDTPLTLLPCLLLESIEQSVGDLIKGGEVVMSGTVHVYDGRVYLLPSSFRLVRRDEAGLSSGQ